MADLIIKDVNFYGDDIIAIKENGKIYVSVKSVCGNLGMTKSQSDYQIQKIQKEELLKGACKINHLKTNGGIQEVLMIELDYLPAWLFKINPARFEDKLKEKLLVYQLKAKDVLAEAFFGKRINETLELLKNDWVVDRIYDRTGQAAMVESEIIKLMEEANKYYQEIEDLASFRIRENNSFINSRKN